MRSCVPSPCVVHGHARDLASEVALFAARQFYLQNANTHAQDYALAIVWFFFTPFEIGSDKHSHRESSVHSLANEVIGSGGGKG